MDFGAEDEGRLTPFEDDNPKDAENTVFQAGSDNSCQARLAVSFVSQHFIPVMEQADILKKEYGERCFAHTPDSAFEEKK